MALLRFANTSKTDDRHTKPGTTTLITSRRTALTDTCGGWNGAISAQPKHCRKVSLNCVWISVPATACIMDAKVVLSSFCLAAGANAGRTPTSPQLLRDGSDTNRPRHNVITTRPYSETIIARIKRDREFARL